MANLSKCCFKCKEIKPLSSFRFREDRNCYSCRCIDCSLKSLREWKKNNPEKIKAYQKEYNKSYYRKNRKKIIKRTIRNQKKRIYQKREYDRNYSKRKRKKDLNYKLTCYLRNRIYGVLKGNTKSDTTKKLLGCSIKELSTSTM